MQWSIKEELLFVPVEVDQHVVDQVDVHLDPGGRVDQAEPVDGLGFAVVVLGHDGEDAHLV